MLHATSAPRAAPCVLRAARPSLRSSPRPLLTPARRVVAPRAALTGAGSGDDPYATLGVHPLAGADEVAAAGSDVAAVATVESAYDAIMMRQLALRMKGQGPLGGIAVSKSVAFADKESLLPAWRPRRADASRQALALHGALALLLCAWSVLHPSPGLQPMTAALVAGFFCVNNKLVTLQPSPAESDAKVAHERKRMARTIGLTLGSIALGIVLAVALPSLASDILRLPLPAWLFIRQEAVINVATTVCLFCVASFYR